MKKAVPWLCTLGYGICGGWSVACLLHIFSMAASPFFAGDSPRYLTFCIVGCIGAALLMIGILVVNVKHFPTFRFPHSTQTVVAAEAILALALLVPCWVLADRILRALPTLF